MSINNKIEEMMNDIKWNSCDVRLDMENIVTLGMVLSVIMNWNEKEREEFDEKYEFTINWNEHGYKNSGTKLHFSSKGIVITEESK